MLTNKDFAILSNFTNCLTPQAYRIVSGEFRECNNLEVFSILTFKDLILNEPRDVEVFLYHSSSLPLLDAMNSYCTLTVGDCKQTFEYAFMKYINTLDTSNQMSLYNCEKLIASTTKIPTLAPYEISSMFMSRSSFDILKNINFKNVNYVLTSILKTLMYSIDWNDVEDIDLVVKAMKSFIDIRYEQLYQKVNVNRYTPRYYIQNISAKSLLRMNGETLNQKVKANFNDTLPQYNPNTILTMYWDTMFLYPFHLKLTSKDPEIRSKYLRPEDFSYRFYTFYPNQVLECNRSAMSDVYGITAFGDNINSMDISHPVVAHNNKAMNDYVASLESMVEERRSKSND